MLVNNMGKLMEYLTMQKRFLKIIYFIIGTLGSAYIYNAVLVPNNIVIGGVGGLAIVLKDLIGVSTTIFINVANVALIIICYFALGKKETLKQLAGCILYPLFVTFTLPIASLIKLDFASPILTCLVGAIIYGLAVGVVYRAGYSTGGMDILVEIISQKFKKSITQISPIINTTIIIISGFVIGPIPVMYAVMFIYISNKVTNFTLNSISTSKMVYVISTKNKYIENYIVNGIQTGATEMRVHSGLFEKKKQMLMCILHNSQYPRFRRKILSLDPEAFILVRNCYEVSGGVKYNFLPF